MNGITYIAHKEGDELAHYGVKGQKWGVRKEIGKDAKAAAIARGRATSLSKQAIYDLNALHHEKPRCELSLDLLAKLIDCSRNQLLYQQKKIHSSYTEKIQQLTEKCEALKHSEPSPNLFWRAQHAG